MHPAVGPGDRCVPADRQVLVRCHGILRNIGPENHQTGDHRLRVVTGGAGRGDPKTAVSAILNTDGKRP